jgi:hypothetical protein
MADDRKAEVGDWIAFYKDGNIIIGEVRYVQVGGVLEDRILYCTSVGATNGTGILEVRKKL